MKVDKLITNNQPENWFEMITNECKGYPINLLSELTEDSTIVDCGCNVGGFFNAYKESFKNWVCIDASTYNIEQFKLNHNNFKGLLLHNALSNNTGEIVKLKKYTDGDFNDTPSGNFGIVDFIYTENNHGWKDNVYEEVETLSLDSLFKFINNDIDLLKVDIEGSEYDFLMNKDLSKIKYLILEIHNFLGEKKLELCSWVEKTHTEIYSEGNGVDSHYVKAFKLN